MSLERRTLDKPEIEIHSPTWKVIEAHANTELSRLRVLNDGPFNDPVQTALLRGRIDVWKQVLALSEKKAPAMEAGDSGGYY